MFDSLINSPFFGLALSAGAWWLGVWLQKKTGWTLCNPLVVAAALVILFLVTFHIPLEAYNEGAGLIKLMLGPATAVLALNIYRQRKALQQYFVPVLVGCLVGSIASVACVLGLCALFQMDTALTSSLLPKSVTTAIAVGIAESRGGIGGITAAAVVFTGVVGAVFAPMFARIFHVKEPVAEGLAIGACSHALGTTKALELGEVQGAMSSIAICVCGIMTSILVLFLPV